MNIIDIAIILFLILGGLIGFKKGFITKLASFLGMFLVIVLAFILKNYVSVLLYENLPFFRFGGIIKGIGAINVLLYEFIAFLIVLAALVFLLRIILLLTGLLEKLVKMTLFLSIPSKILGFIIGVFESYVYIFIILLVLSLPVFNISFIKDAKSPQVILGNTPILSSASGHLIDVYTEVYEVIENQKDKSNTETNEDIMEILLKYDVITVESAEKLIEGNKVEVEDKDFIEKY